MPQFRKKPVLIEATLWTGSNVDEVLHFLKASKEQILQGPNHYFDYKRLPGGLIIKTLEGEHKASIGDWIICGVHGEYYPCKPDAFEETYEPA